MENPDYLISTPENVELHLELAGVGNRVLACLIDTVITYGAVFLLALATAGLCLGVEAARLPEAQITMLNIYFVSAAVLTAFVIVFGYYIYFEGHWQGQTPGKRLLQIRVVDENGAAVTFPAVLIRNLVRTVDTGLGLIGLLFIIFDKQERRLGDLAAGTLVIRERRLTPLSVVPKFGESASLTHHIDAGAISGQEYQIVASFLSRRDHLQKGARQLLAQRLKEYLLAKVGAGELADKPPELFLEVVYLAYQGRAV